MSVRWARVVVVLAALSLWAALIAFALMLVFVDARAATRSCHYRAGGALPDVACTPGVSDPRVKPITDGAFDRNGPGATNIATTICVPGWASAARPPSAYTWRLKIRQMAAYGARGATRNYQEDHLVPLELGGDPRAPGNLWPQPVRAAKVKDKIENELHDLVCSGRLSLWAARGLIATDWRGAGRVARWMRASG